MVDPKNTISNGEKEESKKHHILDDEIVEALQNTPGEDPILTQMGGGGDSDARVKEISDWLPHKDDYSGKTFISPQQAKMIAVARHLEYLFPQMELDREQTFINSILDDFERYLTSIHGMSRDEQVKVLTSMYGSSMGMGDDDMQSATTINLLSNKDDG